MPSKFDVKLDLDQILLTPCPYTIYFLLIKGRVVPKKGESVLYLYAIISYFAPWEHYSVPMRTLVLPTTPIFYRVCSPYPKVFSYLEYQNNWSILTTQIENISAKSS